VRDIRFRAWYCDYMTDDITSLTFETTNGKVTYVFIDGDGVPIDDVNIMQYTGFFDNNGVDIYEGDIFKNSQGELFSIYENKGCYFIHPLKYKFDDFDVAMYVCKKFGEVIGNIYENPELLRNEK
jgi:hypothetical protein